MLGTRLRRSVLSVDLVLRNLQIQRFRVQSMDDIREAKETWQNAHCTLRFRRRAKKAAKRILSAAESLLEGETLGCRNISV
jgi:hypothetical protein